MTMTLSGTSGGIGVIGSGTAVASTSGTSIDFTGLPAGLKRVTVMFSGVSTNGSSVVQVQIGAGSVVSTGYLGAASNISTAVTSSTNSSGFRLMDSNASTVTMHGTVTLTLIGSNTWSQNGVLGRSDTAGTFVSGGSLALGGTLDRVRITTANGTDTFDAGSINILYE